MSRIELLQPFLEGGIRNTNFFNGRLLSAEDLRQEQQANRDRIAQLARAVGAGIVEGLEVDRATQGGGLTNAVVKVSAGLALNENGQALALPLDTEVALVRELEAVNAEAGLFATCEPPTQTAVVSGAGMYLLALTPASGYEQRAPVSGLGSAGLTSPGCGSRYAVEGVQFKLVSVDINTLSGIPAPTRTELNNLMSAGTPANLSLLRNLMAYLCFGAAQAGAFARDVFGASNNPGATPAPNVVEALKAAGELTRCDVPLALIYWTASAGIDFVDMWSVRRRVVHESVTDAWNAPGGDTERALREAMSMQFQTHLEKLRATAQSTQAVKAKTYFRYLPPVGFVPVGGIAGLVGFAYQTLFQNMTYREPVFINGARLPALLHEARSYPPIETQSTEMFWLYLVRENQEAFNAGGANRPQPYLVFAKGHTPYQGDSQYDLAYWNYSNYSLI
ncbi:MAG TPA: hypothetical protein VGW12_13955 [Pyrinomonadaceae bacterium]|nr:hypothetical protein [Pyrinomonadaceae bacterium]